jgi:hypothetical protein
MDIAGSFGLDKKDWSARLDWFEANEPKLLELIHQAETPALYYAGVKAWLDVKAGKPSGYPISLDATASGMQILSCATGDRKAAQICNVVSTPGPTGDHREDAYKNVYEIMRAEVREEEELLHDDVKSAVMKSLFGSKAVPKEVFGEGEMLKAFYKTMKLVCPGVWELNEAFLAMWDPTVLSHDWVMPDNFHVHIKVMDLQTEVVSFHNEDYDLMRKVNAPIKEGRSLSANTTHSIDGFIVREMGRRCSYDPYLVMRVRMILSNEAPFSFIDRDEAKQAHKMVGVLMDLYEKSGYFSARILDYIDSDTIHFVDRNALKELLDSLPKKPFDMATVHDCFRVLPNYGNDLRWQYNNQLALIAESNILEFLLEQIIGYEIPVDKLDYELGNDIINSDYALA